MVALEAQVNEVFRDQSRIRDNMSALERNSSLYRRYLATSRRRRTCSPSCARPSPTGATSGPQAQRELDELISRLAAAAGG